MWHFPQNQDDSQNFYSSIALTGQTPAQVPQWTQVSWLISALPSTREIASTGQLPTQEPQPMHTSLLTFIFLPFAKIWHLVNFIKLLPNNECIVAQLPFQIKQKDMIATIKESKLCQNQINKFSWFIWKFLIILYKCEIWHCQISAFSLTFWVQLLFERLDLDPLITKIPQIFFEVTCC